MEFTIDLGPRLTSIGLGDMHGDGTTL